MSPRNTFPGARRSLFVLVVLAVVGATVAAPVAAASVVFTYDSTPAANDQARMGSTYTHAVSVETNASDGPVMLTVYHEQSADISYDSVTATLGGDSLDVVTSTSTETIGGRTLTRLTFVNRSPPASGTELLQLEATFNVSDDATTESLLTGGVHGPTGETLALVETNVSTSGPNLAPTELTAPSSPVNGSTVTVNGTVENTGDYDATDVDVALLVNGTSVNTTTVDLSVGGSENVSFEWTPSTSGPRELALAVDGGNAILELDEDDNSRSTVVSVDPEPRPDLEPTDLTVPPALTSGSATTVTGNVTNTGDINATGVDVALLVNGTSVNTTTVDLLVDEPVTVSFEWTPSTSGPRELALVTDTADTVLESNETNNRRTTVVDVSSQSTDDGGPSSGGGGGGGSSGPRQLVSVTTFLEGGSSQTIDLGTGPIQSITIGLNETTAGQFGISEFSNPPTDRDPDFQRIATTFTLSGSERILTQPGSLSVTLSRASVSEVGATPDQLRFEYYDEQNTTWRPLETTVVSTSESTVTVSADVPRLTPMFVVAKAPGGTGQDTSDQTGADEPAADETSTDEPTDETDTDEPVTDEGQADTDTTSPTTSTTFPGFGVVAVVSAFVVLTLLGRRRGWTD